MGENQLRHSLSVAGSTGTNRIDSDSVSRRSVSFAATIAPLCNYFGRTETLPCLMMDTSSNLGDYPRIFHLKVVHLKLSYAQRAPTSGKSLHQLL